ncbi:hypothetical protein [Frankia sp. AgB32]|uniref:hypothetical protein n=1 Tax=Frankia sp. AgB32 TaxID=631119 RepID=UPI00200CD305|nr:hypothetical protein [Frankia sp. AgB32]MCK9896902.1 hypothetical protein [Frankia sp. AgB32]
MDATRDIDEDALVVLVDLRGQPAQELDATTIGAIQREYASRLGRRGADTGRVLVVAETARLAEHRQLLVRLAGGSSVSELLLLAVGPQPGGGRLLLPPIAELPVLWAGDVRGFRWTPGLPGRALGADEDGPVNLAGLLDALAIPSVFSRVREILRSCNHQAATPAIHLLLGRVDRAVLDEAAGHAFGHFAQDAGGGSGAPLPDEAVKIDHLLAGAATPEAAGIGSVIDPRGLLPQAAVEARRHLAEAGALIAALREEPFARKRPAPGGGLVPVGELVCGELAQAGSQLGTLARGLAGALDGIGGQDGIDARQRHALATLGVTVVPVPAAEAGEVRAALRRQTDVSLTAREPLGGIAQRLRALAGRATPAGSGPYAHRVSEICPDQLFETLTNPPVFPVWLNLGILPSAFVGAFLAGLRFPWGVLGAAVAVAITVWLTAALYRRRPIPHPKTSPDPRDMSRGQLVWYWLLALAGGLAGVAVGAGGGSPGWPVAVPLLLVGWVLSGAPWLWWRWSVSTWRRTLRLDAAERAIVELGELLRMVALNEWVLADQRLGAARLASALATAVDAAAATLAELRPTPVHPGGFGQPTGAGAMPGRNPASASGPPAGGTGGETLGVSRLIGQQLHANRGALAEIVTDDVGAAIRTVLNARGEEIARERGDDIARDVRETLRRHLAAYHEHLERRGPLAGPPFEVDPRRRTELARKVWLGSTELTRLRQATGSHPNLLQLTNEEDLQLLDQSPDAALFVRFVPRIADATRDEGTGSPAIAGLIRLTQLNPDSARRAEPPTRPADESSPPPPASAPPPAGPRPAGPRPAGPRPAAPSVAAPSVAAPSPAPAEPAFIPEPAAPAAPAAPAPGESATAGSPDLPEQPAGPKDDESPAHAQPAPVAADEPGPDAATLPAAVPPTVSLPTGALPTAMSKPTRAPEPAGDDDGGPTLAGPLPAAHRPVPPTAPRPAQRDDESELW